MDEIIIIPDVHCRDFFKKILQIKDKKIVFLGDYLDPYSPEGFSFENGLANLEEIIDFKKNNPEKVTLLLGNHDWNYIWQFNWASRYNPKYSADAHELFKTNFNLFEPYKIIGNIIFTHAGISSGWAHIWNMTDIILNINNDWNKILLDPFKEQYLSIFDIGHARGGFSLYGGIFWNDINEISANPLDYIQIAGHNQLYKTGSFLDMSKMPYWNGKPFYCCDSREVFIWKNNKLQVYEN